MGADDKIYQLAEESLQRLLQGGGSIALALEIQAALEEAKRLGSATYRLVNASCAAQIWWAKGIMDAATEGRAPSSNLQKRYLN